MRALWDPAKAAANLAKHAVSFPDAETVFSDELAITVEDTRHDEQRFVTLGRDQLGQILVIVYTYPENETDAVRLISARKATHRERELYEDDD